MSNSPLLTSSADVVDVDRSLLKISLLILAVTLAAGLTGFFLEREQLLYGSLTGVIFFTLFIIQNLFIKGLDKLFFASLVESGAMSLPFYQNFSGYFVITVLILIALLFKAAFDSRRELEATIKIRFFRISRLSMNIAVPGVILFFLIMFVIKGGLFTENGVKVLLQPLSPVVVKYIPDFSVEAETGELLNDIVVSSLGEAEIKDLNKLPLWAQNQLIAESVRQFKERIEGFIGNKIDLQKSVSTNVYDALNSGYNNLTSSSRAVLITVVLLLLFSFIRSLVPFIHAPIALFSFVIYEILLASNFAVVQLESRSREVIILK